MSVVPLASWLALTAQDPDGDLWAGQMGCEGLIAPGIPVSPEMARADVMIEAAIELDGAGPLQ